MARRWPRYTGVLIVAVLLIGTATGGVIAMHATRPVRVPRTIALPGQAYSVALDAPAHRAIVSGVANGTGYAATVDTATGALVRMAALGPNPTDVAVAEQTGRVFVTDIVDGTVRVLDARSGRLLRTVVVGQMLPHETPRIVIDARTNRVFVSTSPLGFPDSARSTVHMLDARTGAPLRTTSAGGGSLAVDGTTGRVFAVDLADNTIGVLDGHLGQRIGTIDLSAGLRAFRFADIWHLAVDGSTARLFVATSQGLRVVDTRTGRVVRVIPRIADGEIEIDQARQRAVVVDAPGTVPGTRHIRILDARTGAVLRTVAIPYAYPFVLDSRRGRAIVGTGRAIRAFDVRSGTALWTAALNPHAPGTMALDERTGRVFAVDYGTMDRSGLFLGPGTVSVLDGRTGAIQTVVPVGVGAGSVAVDPQTGHAFVVNAGGPIRASDPWGWLPPWLRGRLPFLPPRQKTRFARSSITILTL